MFFKQEKNMRWFYLGFLALIWGSSFILMKKALVSLSPFHVGALRILITAFFLLLVGYKKIFYIKKRQWFYLTLNSFLGNFFPVFLFAYAINKIDSSVASILNSFTPLNTLVFGFLIFGFSFKKRQLIGVLIGLLGTAVLILKGAEINPNQDYFYSSFILIACVGYAFNVNIIKKYLQDLDALSIATANFLILIPPTLLVLWFTNFFTEFSFSKDSWEGVMYVSILAIFGTALAKVLFNKLIQISTPIFSSSVTYLIPVVAITWGILDGEKITLIQFLAGFVILFGVYLANKTK